MSTILETQTGHYTVAIYTEHAYRNNYRPTTVINDIPAWLVTAIAQRNPYVRISRDWIQETTYTYALGGGSSTRTRLVTEEVLAVCEGTVTVRADDALRGNERPMFAILSGARPFSPREFWNDLSTLVFPTVKSA